MEVVKETERRPPARGLNEGFWLNAGDAVRDGEIEL